MKETVILLLLFTLIGCKEKKIQHHLLVTREGVHYYEDEPYTGKAVSNYSDGQLSQEFNFKDGKRDGVTKIYYENGQLQYEVIYLDDQLIKILLH